jgi:hypothetical protein
LGELQSRSVAVYVNFNPSSTELPRTNDFRQIGLIRKPRFNNAKLTVSGNGFTTGEQVVQYQNVAQLSANVTLTSSSMSGNTSSQFMSALRPGDAVMVANTTASRLAVVGSVTNDQSIAVRENVGTMTNATATLIRLLGDGTVKVSDGTSVTLNNASPTLAPNALLYGITSRTVKGCTGVVFNRRSHSNAFVQTLQLVGTLVSGTFLEDEKLAQGNASAYLHSTSLNGSTTTLFATNEVGTITTGTITGQTSGAVMNITAKYDGDLAPDKGQLVYLENVVPVTRDSTKTETFKIVLEF